MTYLSKLQRFESLYDDRAATALSYLVADAEASREIKRSQDILKPALKELTQLYDAQYVENNLPTEKSGLLTRLEGDISIATQQNLELMQKLINSRRGGIHSLIRTIKFRRFLRSMRRINTSLENREIVRLSTVVGVRQVFGAGRKPVKTACTLIGMLCLRRSMTEMMEALDPASFFRSDDVVFEGAHEASEQTRRHPRKVLIIIGNHDSGVYDIALAQRLSQRLGSEHHIIMTRKSVYPIPPPEAAGDVVYVNDSVYIPWSGDPKSNAVGASLLKVEQALTKNDVVSLAVYPEGMLTFTGGQMPLVTKEGAFVIARKLAVELKDQGVPVYLVEAKSNTLLHLTQNALIQAAVRILNVEVVPTTPLASGKKDEWIDAHRRETENRFNADRGEKMLNILSSGRIPDSMTYEAHGLRLSELHPAAQSRA